MALIASNLTKTFTSGFGATRVVNHAVNDVSLRVEPGDFVAVVGESGSGKSTTARILLDLIRATSGSVTWNGSEVAAMTKADRLRFRADVQAVFQDPSGSLNPRKRIRRILGEVIDFYGLADSKSENADIACKMLSRVGLTPAQTFMERFPHELSGGQRQRVLIARSMIPNPKIVIADEAVSALDVSVKADILGLMEDLRHNSGVGYLLISHDLQVVRKVARYTYVMQAGRVIEEGPTENLFRNPAQPYTRDLIGAVVDLDTVLQERTTGQAALTR